MNTSEKTWQDQLWHLAYRALGAEKARPLQQKYAVAFPPAYQQSVLPRNALQDLLCLEALTIPDAQPIRLLKPCPQNNHYRLNFYSVQQRYLDEYMPLLENLNLRVIDQVSYCLTVDSTAFFIRSFMIKPASNHAAPFSEFKDRLLETLSVLLAHMTENDALNKLVVLTGISWQAVDVLRAYRNYFLQLGQQTTRASIHHALIHNPQVALNLFNYFEARFRPDPVWDDPMVREEQVLFPLRMALLESLSTVSDLNDDRILRTLFNLIDATMRSNFHVRQLDEDYFLSFKINSLGIIDMPAPRPQTEIYVHGVDMEGIHLRAGKIARGGIRWSDRPDDFRKEILGLMQTQVSKNALIVPTGSKGGFVLKKANGKSDTKEAGIKAYTRLIKGLLDLTDSYVGPDVVKPHNLVCYDDPDPYLVVAADKGTAQFSDRANAVSAAYQFWLGDAFASGGSHGYDHKALGITARGAWECIKRHFRELGKDIQTEPFTVVGIGSMDGDVFGNGMMQSPCIRLLAAFSGQHIFIDPTPSDLQAALEERKRLFNTPGSTWADYDPRLISEGGGVYLRSSKAITLTPEVKKWLNLRYKYLDGESLIRYLLGASVDLLWLGGIGTYIKASSEKHSEVGDRANDNVRIDAINLNARVVGEGANLGFTQKARIEYALKGGRINTDAVDNSAGVDTSDHEVNLKILLTGLHKQGLIEDYQPLFMRMTAEVSALVLADNIAQSLCLSLDSLRCADSPALFLGVAEHLEAAGFLDCAVESFPGSKAVLARAKPTLMRPEIATLMASSKLYLTHVLLEQTDLLQQPCFEPYLQAYFPNEIQQDYTAQLAAHPLAKEIKATQISNKIINQAGCGFLGLATDEAEVLAAVGCYLAFDQVLNADGLRQQIAALDNKILAATQYASLLAIENCLLGFCRWALTKRKNLCPNAETIACYSTYLSQFETCFWQKEAALVPQDSTLPLTLAQKLHFIGGLGDFLFLVDLAQETAGDFVTVVNRYHELKDFLGLDLIFTQLAKLSLHDDWERKLAADLPLQLQHVLAGLVKTVPAVGWNSYFALPENSQKLAAYQSVYAQIKNAMPQVPVPYVVLSQVLAGLLGQE